MKKLLISFYLFCLEVIRTIQNDIFLSGKHPTVENHEVTIKRIKQEHCSMSRFGDGEFSLIRGESLKFQPYDEGISSELKTILRLPPEEKGILVCIPDVFSGANQYIPRAEKYWNQYVHKYRAKIYKLLRFDRVYNDALITRFYVDYKDKSRMDEKVAQLRSIWEKKHVLIVEGEKSRLGMGNDLFDNTGSVRRIVCPAVNAYSKIDAIENSVLSTDGYDLVLIALGPTATVLAYRLYCKGIQALDIGHIDIEYEWYKKGVQEKEPVRNKYIGEMPGGDVVEDVIDERYEKQIIRRIQ